MRGELQRRFTHIFVDEFQDTDPLQAEILVLLAGADPAIARWRDVTPAPGKLFVVGDPKQSIYRFRRADVGIYQEVKALLQERGAAVLELTSSFRAVPTVQRLVNAAFAPRMIEDHATLQAGYVPLAPYRQERDGQPSVVALPVPRPYGRWGLTKTAIDESLPDAVGAFVRWLVQESGWRVTERDRPEEVPVAPRHVCLLFRRFTQWGADITQPYVEALEARGIPHMLVGGKSFHLREEVESLRTALTALLTRTEYVLPQPDACWVQILVQNDAEFAGFSQGNWQAFTPGQHVTANWTAQPSRPGSSSREQTSPSRAPPADRATR